MLRNLAATCLALTGVACPIDICPPGTLLSTDGSQCICPEGQVPGADGCVADPCRTPETCNTADDDCDGNIDEDASSMCMVANGGAVCVDGTCQVAQCAVGFGDCDPTPGCETDLRSSAAHCGTCNAVCTTTCDQGDCPGQLDSLFTATTSHNGAVLVGATVELLNSFPPQTTTTGANGSFSLSVKSFPATVRFAAPGFEPTIWSDRGNSRTHFVIDPTELARARAVIPQTTTGGTIAAFVRTDSPRTITINRRSAAVAQIDSTGTVAAHAMLTGNAQVFFFNVEPGPYAIFGCTPDSLTPTFVREGAITLATFDCP